MPFPHRTADRHPAEDEAFATPPPVRQSGCETARMEQPPAVTLCWHCDATDDNSDPAGWMTVSRGSGPTVGLSFGICPTCLSARYHS